MFIRTLTRSSIGSRAEDFPVFVQGVFDRAEATRPQHLRGVRSRRDFRGVMIRLDRESSIVGHPRANDPIIDRGGRNRAATSGERVLEEE